MLIPYAAKNPTKRFPIATVSIIAVNVLVYLFTTHSFLSIKEGVVEEFGCLFGTTPFYTIITAMFLHGDPLHILGNMLFLWVFGPSVEDRLGIAKYLGLYFVTGTVGTLLQVGMVAVFAGKNLPCIGASACIMGVVGAYWYMFSWSPICCFYCLTLFIRGTAEIKAFWVIGVFFLLDVIEGLGGAASGMTGGVGNFAHIGGTVAGALICAALKVRRDSSEVSEAKALHSDAKDLYKTPQHALETMMLADPHNVELIRELATRALRSGEKSAVHNAMLNAGPSLIDLDARLVASYVTDLHGDPGIYRSIHLLRLAGMMERSGDPGRAAQIYSIIANGRPNDLESETALYRLALITWNVSKNAERARECIVELQRRFPHGDMTLHANTLMKRMSGA